VLDHGVTGSVDEILKLGLPGVVILALAFTNWRFFKLYCTTQTKLSELQEKRVVEGKEGVEALKEATVAIDRLSDLVRDRLGRV
jgi:hypothetical protein